ncbi:MAG TPA: class I SAM-dependent methyltransferase [Anaerolineales bacterium]|nr:class I SAM-dependent methyltransferase [Anaerolineales bacterium]
MPFDKYYFSTHTYEGVSFKKYSQYWWSNRFYAGLARRFGEEGSNLLEIGSGLGHLVGQLDGHFRTFGIDVNPWALSASKNVAGSTHLQVASADRLPFESDSFGVVIIKHVVEHLQGPALCITEIGRLLKPGGVLILSTPNLESLLKPWKGDRWIGYQDPTHISLKQPAEWLQMVASAGLKTRRVFADGFWDVPYVKGLPKGLQKIIFGSLGGLQAVTRFIFLPYRWGESIIIIARKP